MRSVSPPRFYEFAVVCRPKLKKNKKSNKPTQKSHPKAAKKGTVCGHKKKKTNKKIKMTHGRTWAEKVTRS